MQAFEGTLDSCIHQKLSCTTGELSSHVTLYLFDIALDEIMEKRNSESVPLVLFPHNGCSVLGGRAKQFLG